MLQKKYSLKMKNFKLKIEKIAKLIEKGMVSSKVLSAEILKIFKSKEMNLFLK